MFEIITPVVTIFDKNEKIDMEGNKEVIDFLLKEKIDGILVLGSSGEFTNLSFDEKLDFLKFYSDYTNNRTNLYAGTSCPKLEDTVLLSNKCLDLGYKAVVIIGPYYYALDQEKIFVYYNDLAKKIKGDIYIYNFPARSGHSIESKTLKKLIDENDNIKGLKDSVTLPGHTNELCRVVNNETFKIYSGFDDQYLYNISTGGKGCIAALSNIVPDIWSDLVKASNNNEFKKVLTYSNFIHRLMPLYDLDSNFSLLFKKIMRYRGLEINDTSIFPFNQIDDDKVDTAIKILDDVLEDYKNIEL